MNDTVKIIEKFEPQHAILFEAWSDFLGHHRYGSAFQLPGFFQALEASSQVKPALFLVLREGHILGGMLVQVYWEGARAMALLTTRAIIMDGPLFLEDDFTTAPLLFKSYERYAQKNHIIYSQIREYYPLPQEGRAWCEAMHFTREPHWSITLDLTLSKEELWHRMHRSRRKNVNLATKKGLQWHQLESTEEILRAQQLIEQTYLRKGMPFAYANLIFKAYRSLGDHYRMYGCYNVEGEMISTMARLCYKDRVYSWFDGSARQALKDKPNDFLTWKILLVSKEEGYLTYDFGGGGKPGEPYGVREYKLRYGGEKSLLNRYTLVHKKGLYTLGQYAFKRYKYIKRLNHRSL